jgi:hypothetical protein
MHAEGRKTPSLQHVITVMVSPPSQAVSVVTDLDPFRATTLPGLLLSCIPVSSML